MQTKKQKIKALDLFAGCGGLTEGFEMTGLYETVAGVEWDKSARDTLTHRLANKWDYVDAEERMLLCDIQETRTLLKGWSDDPRYGSHPGLDTLVEERGGSIDLIVGGPPCQAYSVAGRIRDKNGMRDDYRNFLFEKYAGLVQHFRPYAFIFENVPGMLSAKPGGVSIVDRVRDTFSRLGYSLINDPAKYALVDASEYGVPQNRKRLVLFGIRNDVFEGNAQELLEDFYTRILPLHKKKRVSVAEAIFDLPKFTVSKSKKEKHSHTPKETNVPNHISRYHSLRDISIFKKLALDITRTKRKYDTVEALKKLYTEETGNISSVHKYYVLEANKQSNTIVSHLHKDGLRHIHPDPKQARSITVREAARLQSFPDDFIFLGSVGDQYKMVGNAVPPLLAEAIAHSVASFFEKFLVKESNIDAWKKNLMTMSS